MREKVILFLQTYKYRLIAAILLLVLIIVIFFKIFYATNEHVIPYKIGTTQIDSGSLHLIFHIERIDSLVFEFTNGKKTFPNNGLFQIMRYQITNKGTSNVFYNTNQPLINEKGTTYPPTLSSHDLITLAPGRTLEDFITYDLPAKYRSFTLGISFERTGGLLNNTYLLKM